MSIDPRTESVGSADGTTISYRATGSGPGLVVVPGAGLRGRSYMRLAGRLADGFTVYSIDRRGRGDSGPKGHRYGIERELEDVAAVLQATKSRLLFGHSYGGLISAEVARVLPLDAVVLYDPAISISGSYPLGWLPEFEQAIDKRQFALAQAILLVRGQIVPPPLDVLPIWSGRPIMAVLLGSPQWRDARETITTIPSELREIARADCVLEHYARIAPPTLLIYGEHSPEYMKKVGRDMVGVLPDVEMVVLPGLNHGGPTMGSPETVADRARQFFTRVP